MPDEDIVLIKKWIAAGVPGDQCVPGDNNGKECDGLDVRVCDADGNLARVEMTCSEPTPLCAYGACVLR